jgi:hypothetical protein
MNMSYTDERTDEMRAVADTISQMRTAAIEQLKTILTKRNFATLVNEFIPKIIGTRAIFVETFDNWCPRFTLCNIVDVSHNMDDKCFERDLVRTVYPYTIIESFRTDRWQIRHYHYIVSRAKFDSHVHGIMSDVEEDNIHDVTLHRNYCRRHSVRIYDGEELIENPESSFFRWSAYHRRAMWCNLHGHLLDICLALAPLGLSSYELLWILDYLPPMDFKWYKDGRPYDANHLRKLRLYESTMRSYKLIRP